MKIYNKKQTVQHNFKNIDHPHTKKNNGGQVNLHE